MKTVYPIIKALQSVSGANAKIAILKENSDNEALKKFLQVTYSQTYSFYVSAVDPSLVASMTLIGSTPVTLDSVIDTLISDFTIRKISGGEAKRWLATQYHLLSQEERTLLCLLIGRDIKAGVGPKTINKVWPGLIVLYPYMRCDLPKASVPAQGKKKAKKGNLDNFKWDEGVYSELKADGMFANMFVYNTGIVSIRSRAGTELFAFDSEVYQELRLIYNGTSQFSTGVNFHGELLLRRHGAILPRETSNGIFNSMIQTGEALPDDVDLLVRVWDIVPIENYWEGRWEMTRKERLNILERGINSIVSKFFEVIPYKIVYSIPEAITHYQAMLLRGEEGTVPKCPSGIWQDGTSSEQIKMKLIVDVELEVVEFNKGNGKFEKTFGSVHCKTSDGFLHVNVPASGMKMFVHERIYEIGEEAMKGQIFTVRSNSIMRPTTEGGHYSLFLPRFVEHRLDKFKADSLADVEKQFKQAVNQFSILN